jgi:CRP-like cAMP-binding protein
MRQPSFRPFNIDALLGKEGIGKKPLYFAKQLVIFSYGDRSDSIFYIDKGIIKLSVISEQGREAIIGLLSAGHLVGESCIASDQPARFHNAIALTPVRVIRIDRRVMIRLMRSGEDIGYSVVDYLLRRNFQTQEDLVNILLSSGEERLARVLLLLTQTAKTKDEHVPKLTQQTLANMIGTTRQRVNILMKRFRKSGVINDAQSVAPSINFSMRNAAFGERETAHNRPADAAKAPR